MACPCGARYYRVAPDALAALGISDTTEEHLRANAIARDKARSSASNDHHDDDVVVPAKGKGPPIRRSITINKVSVTGHHTTVNFGGA